MPQYIHAWIDEESLLLGENVGSTLQSAIYDAVDFVVIFLGQKAIESSWVRKELEWAIDRENKLGQTFILPVLLEIFKFLRNVFD